MPAETDVENCLPERVERKKKRNACENAIDSDYCPEDEHDFGESVELFSHHPIEWL